MRRRYNEMMQLHASNLDVGGKGDGPYSVVPKGRLFQSFCSASFLARCL